MHTLLGMGKLAYPDCPEADNLSDELTGDTHVSYFFRSCIIFGFSDTCSEWYELARGSDA